MQTFLYFCGGHCLETFGQKSDLMCFEMKKVAPKVKCRCFFRGHILQFFSDKFGEIWEKNIRTPKFCLLLHLS